MTPKVSVELINRQASELQHIPVSRERVIELASEVDNFNRDVFEAARNLDFNDEPIGFLRVLVSRRRYERTT
jgi:hypothetical protein